MSGSTELPSNNDGVMKQTITNYKPPITKSTTKPAEPTERYIVVNIVVIIVVIIVVVVVVVVVIVVVSVGMKE